MEDDNILDLSNHDLPSAVGNKKTKNRRSWIEYANAGFSTSFPVKKVSSWWMGLSRLSALSGAKVRSRLSLQR